jgi:DNA-binding MarR family transcriptional regulator
LVLLGRTLMKIGEEAIPTEGKQATGVRSVLIVLLDIIEHPDSSVGEITARTGFPQSHVSASVARLREAGSVVTEVDSADRRRLLVRKAPKVSERALEVASTPIDAALGAALGTDDVAEVVAQLEALAERLTPDTLARLRAARN